jgi:hypothetical protein
MKSSMVPARLAARIIPRPSGNSSNSIFSPGMMPRCSNTFLRKVTCPRVVTVNVFMGTSTTFHCNAQLHYCHPERLLSGAKDLSNWPESAEIPSASLRAGSSR